MKTPEPHQGMGLKLALDARGAASAWRTGCVMVTLKSLSTFGILPAMDPAKVPEEFREPVHQAIERALDAAFRESPISVIDHCRNAMTVLVSRWPVANGHHRSIMADDLAKAGSLISDSGRDSQITRIMRVLCRDSEGGEAWREPTARICVIVYGSAPKGERLRAGVPHGQWKTTTFIGALRQSGMVAPMVLDGPINGVWFHAYIEQVLVPELRPGDIVIMDNLGSHKGAGVRASFADAGGTRFREVNGFLNLRLGGGGKRAARAALEDDYRV
ncbi:hypothetical protein Nham_2003 [Nitrobacter hamburgensis X14]|uniref:Tc1-like transposase DDE domain-containing protein n=1 Tax=Nitrobacter hamburgensis (strain DSM 10229 / NCIMB 13809 / X14) TaxID=323097 RepID=Q1QLU5_NITHX|nr:hypothetical protein Nham_2003 [Nitrobacter hamburgensis X14]